MSVEHDHHEPLELSENTALDAAIDGLAEAAERRHGA